MILEPPGHQRPAVLPDSTPDQWLLRATPAAWWPFIELARLDRPIGWWLLLLPCWWSSALASSVQHTPPNLWHLALFFVGAVAMRGAGTTYNDLADRNIDAKVARTRGRPLPSGRVSPRSAKIFLVAQALVGLGVLLCFNRFSIALGLSSLIIVGIYPFMKRLTSWPQAVLGLAFAFGALMGWAAAFGALAPPPLLLYVGAIAWTIGFDTIYALQDLSDDMIAGVKSTALFFGRHVRLAVGICYGICVIFVALALFAAGVLKPLASLGLLAMAAHFTWQIGRLDPEDPALALKLFRSNRDAGLLLFAGLAGTALSSAFM
ncbi:4-hydroxybenzoate octaprenyltransferase [Methylovirgula sp. HY1]|uniref:4-hydroxybenzoate octaprenyltransferase n=1 Tax=Methylovirgula sp. HY1 TaxID=2822761 RepID=UPI001C7581C5|nr:4-hydroxybenzoate octaprenyltransferase [Methylovirgula sp. HY1]